MTDLLADHWPEADPDHCLQSCSWSGLTNTASWHLWVRQYSSLCCHSQLPWSVASLVDQRASTAPSIVLVTLQSSAFQMQKLLGPVKYISMSAKLGQERGVLSKIFSKHQNTLSCHRCQNFQNSYLVINLKQAKAQGLQHFCETMAHVFLPVLD